MKTIKTELDVDFIGGHGPLTTAEEKALSDFFKQRKLASKKPASSKKHAISKRPNVSA